MKRRMLVGAMVIPCCVALGLEAVGQAGDVPATATSAPPQWAARPLETRWLDKLPVAIHRVELDKPGLQALAVVVDASPSAGTRWLAVTAEVAVSSKLPLADVAVSTSENTYQPVGIGYGSGATVTRLSGKAGSITVSAVPEFCLLKVWPHSKIPAVTFNPMAGHWALAFEENPDKTLRASGVFYLENVKKTKNGLSFLIVDGSNTLAITPPEKKKAKDTAEAVGAPVSIWLLYEISEKDASADSGLQFAVNSFTKSPLSTSN